MSQGRILLRRVGLAQFPEAGCWTSNKSSLRLPESVFVISPLARPISFSLPLARSADLERDCMDLNEGRKYYITHSCHKCSLITMSYTVPIRPIRLAIIFDHRSSVGLARIERWDGGVALSSRENSGKALAVQK